VSRLNETIKKKRDGQELSEAEIRQFIEGVTDGSAPDYQAAALLMAVFFRGLSPAELATWTDAMLHSGQVLDLSGVSGCKVDKHSTGGVGDKVSLALAPLVAAAGVRVPMISGRGLGHTGGTLDKLEAIPGFRVDLDTDRFIELTARLGTCMIGQTEDLAPADRRLYALRDVTATVESIPLISASIMSKKLAAGLDGLVLDVKVGQGAFMKDQDQARCLAETLVGIGRSAGKKVWALLTAMDQPLGLAVGNALETAEAIDVLHGAGPADLRQVTIELGARMLVLGDQASDLDQARQRLEELIANGRAAETMKAMVKAQGGDVRVVDEPRMVMPQARIQQELPAQTAGFVQDIGAEKIGMAAMALGAGRAKAADSVDPAVGLVFHKKVGDSVSAGQALATIYANDEELLAGALPRIAEAITIGSDQPPRPSLIVDEICP
jgi:pyrimidine-nucleoside phosphorylase/thymidine phosphorylase